MARSDYSGDSQKVSNSSSGCALKFGTLVFILGTICLLVFFVYTYIAPNNPYNPFPPVSENAEAAPATLAFLPSHTPILIPTTTATITPEFPTSTVTPLPPPTEAVITILAPSMVPESSLHFVAQSGTPVYTGHPRGCDGIYLSGNVIDRDGNPLPGLVVKAAGLIGETPIVPEPSTSGSHPEFSPSGWEIKLSDTLGDSSGTIFVALFSPDSDDPISDLVFVDTFDDCNRNMIMVNFLQQ
jgi:hypothetical protein